MKKSGRLKFLELSSPLPNWDEHKKHRSHNILLLLGLLGKWNGMTESYISSHIIPPQWKRLYIIIRKDVSAIQACVTLDRTFSKILVNYKCGIDPAFAGKLHFEFSSEIGGKNRIDHHISFLLVQVVLK